MRLPIRKTHPVLKILNHALVDLPAPRNLSVWWNFGFLLGICLTIQLITGIFLAMHYTPHVEYAFSSVAHIIRDVNHGWLLRNIHANTGSAFFICMYIHVGRGIYYRSYLYKETWLIGVVLLIATIATAFVGYVLPWGQIRFWGATVITNLLSAIPYIGKTLVEWLWGGYSVSNPTLNRFFVFHFLLPFILVGLSALHLIFLHQTGSNNPLGIDSDSTAVRFHPYYTTKDLLALSIIITLIGGICLFSPNLLGDPENFIPANPLSTPVHIKPEWYFLWAYAILRSIPHKLGGVAAIFGALLILATLPITHFHNHQSTAFYPLNQILFWGLVTVFALLTWIGACPVEPPYENLGRTFTALYFGYFVVNPITAMIWDKASL